MAKINLPDYLQYLNRQAEGVGAMMLTLKALKERISLPLVIIDICEGSHVRAALLSQILYWSLPNDKNDNARMEYLRDEHYWIVRQDSEWWKECRVKERTVREHMLWLVEKELIISNSWLSPFKDHRRTDGNKSLARHIRINWPVFAGMLEDMSINEVTDFVSIDEPVTKNVTTEVMPVTKSVTTYISGITEISVSTKDDIAKAMSASALNPNANPETAIEHHEAINPSVPPSTFHSPNLLALEPIVKPALLKTPKQPKADKAPREWKPPQPLQHAIGVEIFNYAEPSQTAPWPNNVYGRLGTVANSVEFVLNSRLDVTDVIAIKKALVAFKSWYRAENKDSRGKPLSLPKDGPKLADHLSTWFKTNLRLEDKPAAPVSTTNMEFLFGHQD